jgi:undecaprenyl-diphosphatase
MVLEWLKALLWGLIEGVTEWLPVSSTGHLILFESLFPFAFCSDQDLLSAFCEMLEVVIQLGAILAVVVLYWKRLVPFFTRQSTEERIAIGSLWLHLLVASIPTALIGTVGDRLLERFSGKDIDGWLYNAPTVALMLILYGVAFLLVERSMKRRMRKNETVADFSYRTVFLIGCFQTLSIVPGTSRSGATILGAMLLGTSRTAAAEFSFFLAIPAMLGASAIKILGFVEYLKAACITVPTDAWVVLAVACVTSFFVSMIAIRFLTDFVKRHSFAAFGVYRIALGAAVLLWWCTR